MSNVHVSSEVVGASGKEPEEDRMENITTDTGALSDDHSGDELDRVVEQLTNEVSERSDEVFDEEIVEEEDDIGAMNQTLPAGGFDEMVMAENEVGEDEYEEEYIDDSYEEEFVEETMHDDEDMEEILSESNDVAKLETHVEEVPPAMTNASERSASARSAPKVTALIEASERSTKSAKSVKSAHSVGSSAVTGPDPVDPLMGQLSQRSIGGGLDKSGRSTKSAASVVSLDKSSRSNKSFVKSPTSAGEAAAALDKSGRSNRSVNSAASALNKSERSIMSGSSINKSGRSTKSVKSTTFALNQSERSTRSIKQSTATSLGVQSQAASLDKSGRSTKSFKSAASSLDKSGRSTRSGAPGLDQSGLPVESEAATLDKSGRSTRSDVEALDKSARSTKSERSSNNIAAAAILGGAKGATIMAATQDMPQMAATNDIRNAPEDRRPNKPSRDPSGEAQRPSRSGIDPSAMDLNEKQSTLASMAAAAPPVASGAVPTNIQFSEEEDIEMVDETAYSYEEETVASPVHVRKAAVVEVERQTKVASETKAPDEPIPAPPSHQPTTVNDVSQGKKGGIIDLEAGLPGAEGTKSGAPAEKKSASGSPKNSSLSSIGEPERVRSGGTLILAGCICLLLITLAIVLPLVLKKDDAPRDSPPILPPVSLSPSQSSRSPSLAPIARPPTPMEWVDSLPSDFFGPKNSGFGSAVSLGTNLFASGAPLFEERGAVYTGIYDPSQGAWNLIQPPVLGDAAGDGFGAAVDVLGEQMVVGAPTKAAEGALTPVGAAYFYTLNPSGDTWLSIGTALRGNADIFDANAEFGSAVALGVASSPRVVAGAPKTSVDMQTFEAGRVYTFEGTGIAWNPMQSTPLFGKNPFDWFGASVDMTNDGSRFIVGAPGNGESDSGSYVQVYVWDESQWVVDFEQDGDSGEQFGSSVLFLSDEIFAVGGPGFENGAGRVVVYQRKESGARASDDYVRLGEAIVGEPGGRLGSPGTMSGGIDDEGLLLLILGSVSGKVDTLGYNSATDVWESSIETLNTGGSGLALDYSVADGLMAGFGDVDQVVLYETRTVLKSSAPVMPPTTTSRPVASPPTTQTPVEPTTTSETPVEPSTTSAPVEATVAPVAAIPSSQAPAVTPVSADTTLDGWLRTGGQFSPRAEGSSFGSSVSLSASNMAVGAPTTVGDGAVFVFQKLNGEWESEASSQLFGETNMGGSFGTAVDLTDLILVAGAPTAFANGTLTEAGAAYCYIANNGNWEKLGPTLRGDDSIFGANEQFGASVAATSNGIVVVGAPGSSVDLVMGRGRVYVFQYIDASSTWEMIYDALGSAESASFGSVVDISSDGTHIIVGAPGENGYVELFEFNGSSWVSTLVLFGVSGEAFGSSVEFISATGSIFAVGAPGAMNGQGRVAVYQRNNAGTFVQVGPSLVGFAGERLGAANTLGGDGFSPSIVFGTAAGVVRRFDFDASVDEWVQNGGNIDTGFGSDLMALAAASQSQEFVVGGNVDAAIYESV